MESLVFPEDFKEFLRLLNDLDVKYLLIGGYAVGYYGYPRTTADMDVWVDASPENAALVFDALHRFGIRDPKLTVDIIQERGKILRMGLPPMRIEVLNDIDGVAFDLCYSSKETALVDGLKIDIISLPNLKKNKKASGRYKDLDDLEHLPE